MKKLLSAVAVIAVVGFAASSVWAVTPVRSVGFEAGYVSPDLTGVESSGTWVGGVFADFGLPAANLTVNPFINYWSWSESANSFDTSFRDVSVGANLKYAFPTASVKFQPFIAGGLGIHLLNASVEGSDPLLGSYSLDQGDTKIGFQGGAGFKVGVSQNANLITSGWYNVVDNANNWSLRAGMAWSL
ncbi:MAG TPA: hypothetical protein VFX92_02590 [Candidatus Krumholzibacteria bacterium]|nr:hypothetical protein [Candidatus Krumholzibacteria bacterium]